MIMTLNKLRCCINKLDRLSNSKLICLLIIPFAAIFVTFYSYTTSPIFIDEGMDSCVFKTMGLAILKGKTPYVDFFDHKGPMLYFINAFGQWLIPGRLGIYFLQIIAEAIIFNYIYKTIRLFINGWKSVLILLSTLYIYSGIYQEGNQCEEWSLLAIAPSVYYSIEHFIGSKKKNIFNNYYGLILGLMFGWVFYTRPNDAASLIGGCMTGLFLYQLKTKQHRQNIRNVLWFLLGFFIVSAPISAYFASRNALYDLFYGLIKFNSMYSGGTIHMLLTCAGRTKMTIFLLFASMSVLVLQTNKKMILYVLCPIIIFSWILIGVPIYPHYLIGLIPLFAVLLSFLFCQKSKSLVAITLCLIYCSSNASSVNIIKAPKEAFTWRLENYRNPNSYKCNTIYKETGKLFEKIPIQERDSIWNYNLYWEGGVSQFSILWHNKIVQCNKIPIYSMLKYDRQLKMSESVKNHKPLWILLTKDYGTTTSDCYDWDNDIIFIENNYYLIAKTDSTISKIELYKRK